MTRFAGTLVISVAVSVAVNFLLDGVSMRLGLDPDERLFMSAVYGFGCGRIVYAWRHPRR